MAENAFATGLPEPEGDTLNYEVEVVATGLEIPWALVFIPDGRILVTERPGRIRVIGPDGLMSENWASLPVANWRAAGLSGIALDPDYSQNRHVYVVGTFRVSEDQFENRIYRFTDSNGKGVDQQLIVDGLESIDTHAGGAFAFGPDGKMYLALGDGERIEEVQDWNSYTGKILRYNKDGSIPEDNPDSESAVWALGLRNPQGFAWHPETGELFATEHGPSGFDTEGGRTDQDELNQIVKRGNYGWPIVSGMHENGEYIKPIIEWTPAIAPSGLAIVTDPKSSWYGQLFVGGLRGRNLQRVVIQSGSDHKEGWRVAEEEAIFEDRFGRIRAVHMSPDGYLYFTTSNRNTPGEPIRKLSSDDDDRVLRV